MGVKGLTTYTKNLPGAWKFINLHEMPQTGKREIVVDGCGLLRNLYHGGIDWIRGGQFTAFKDYIVHFCSIWQKAGWSLTVFFDGGIGRAKRSIWVNRRRQETKMCQRLFDTITNNPRSNPSIKLWMAPCQSIKTMAQAFQHAGCQVYFTLGEADREIAEYANQVEAFAILAEDSDFIVFDIDRYLSIDKMTLARGKLQTQVLERKSKESAFGFPSKFMPLLASLVGNDFVNDITLKKIHASLNVETMGVIPAVINFCRSLHPSLDPSTDLPEILAKISPEVSQKSIDVVKLSLDQYDLYHHHTHSVALETFASPLIPMSFHRILSSGETVLSKLLQMHKQGTLDSEVLAIACQRCVNIGTSIEQQVGERILPPAWRLAQPIMRRIYGMILVDDSVTSLVDALKNMNIVDGPEEKKDKVIQEWVSIPGKDMREPEMVTPLTKGPLGKEVKSLADMMEATEQERLINFLNVVGCEDVLPRIKKDIPLQLIYVVAVIRTWIYSPLMWDGLKAPLPTLLNNKYTEIKPGRRLSIRDLQCLVAMVCQLLVPVKTQASVNYRNMPINPQVVQISTIWLRTIGMMRIVNDVCLRPLPVFYGWQVHDGILLHNLWKLHLPQPHGPNLSGTSLCDPKAQKWFEWTWKAIWKL